MSIFARALGTKSFDTFWSSPPDDIDGYRGALGHGKAYGLSTVWRCINIIGGALGSTPFVLYRRRAERGRDRATDDPRYRMLRLEPAPRMTAFRYRSVAMNHLLTWGNHYAEIIYDGASQPVELHGLRPDRMQVRFDDNGDRIYLYRNRLAMEIRLPERKVFHVPGLGFDGLVGYPPLTLMRETIGSYTAARDFGANFFRNGARPAVVIKHKKTMSTGAIERLTAQMDRLRGSGNAGKTVLLEEDADFKELGIAPEDAQYMESQKFYGVAEIARWFGVPPHMVGDVDRSTSWGTGIEEQKTGFDTETMLNWFTSWEQETDVQLLPPAQDDLYVEFLLDVTMRAKTLDRWQAYQIARNIGALSPNDILDRENMNPREDPGGDEYLLPLNMESVGGPDDNGAQTFRTIAAVDPRTQRNGHNPVPVEVTS